MMSLKLNIEQKLFLSNENALFIEGWAFFDSNDSEMVILGDYEYELEKLSRIDVYHYFNRNKFALNCGFRAIVKFQDTIPNEIILAVKSKDESTNLTIKVYDSLIENNNKGLTTYYKKFIGNIKRNGLIETVRRTIIFLRQREADTSTFDTEVLNPYNFVEEAECIGTINKSCIDLIINATSPINNKFINECLNSINIQYFNKIFVLSTDENIDILNVIISKNCTLIKTQSCLKTKRECAAYFINNAIQFTGEYILFLNIEDKLAKNACFELSKVIEDNRYKAITADEDRFINSDYFAPFYKNDLFILGQEVSFDKLTRKLLALRSDCINDYVNNKIDLSQVKIINKVLYHYRLEYTHSDNKVKALAYYLPQFHSIPENDKWWGKGFTEWVNTKKAVPLFEGHYQPHEPGELGYYNLVEDNGIQKKQATLAEQYNIHGFCYYYYWFNGKKLLEKPLEKMLKDPEIKLPFCICWANETWSRRWDGMESEILIKQVHDEKSDEAFIDDIMPVLQDERYIRINGAPLILVYRIGLFKDFKKTAQCWRKKCFKNGIKDIKIAAVQAFGFENPLLAGCDYAVEFPPHNAYSRSREILTDVKIKIKDFCGNIYNYKDTAARGMNKRVKPYIYFRGSMLNWDNTARRAAAARIFHNSSPYEYKKWLASIIDFTTNFYPEEERFIFINAWNEWAEGTHLEPDKKYGRQYLEATKEALGSSYT